jgi:hypothetical protein
MRQVKVGVAVLLAAALAGVGCRTTQVSSEGSSAVASHGPTEPGGMPPGTQVKVRLNQPLGAPATQVGDSFTATVENPVTGPGGEVLVPAGATVRGKVTGLKASEHVGDQAAIRLDFDSLEAGGSSSPLAAEVVDTKVRGAKGSGKRVGAGAGIGAAGGAALGAIFGQSLGAALLGGVLGAGAGTVIALGTGETQARLPAGTELALRTTAPTKPLASRPRTTY